MPPEEVCVFTAYTKDNAARLKMSRIGSENQKKYCELYGYPYQAHEESFKIDVLPYWSKIAGILSYLKGDQPHCQNAKWVVWVDDDALFMNSKIPLSDYILSHAEKDPSVHVMVTQDAQSKPGDGSLNTGLIFAKVSKASRDFFDALWDKRHQLLSSMPYSYGNCPNQRCFHEQEAMQDLLKEKPWFKTVVQILPQRGKDGVGINTFRRFDHYDSGRGDVYLAYSYDDPQENLFQQGDFISQCTGMALNGYTKQNYRPRNLRLECIGDLSSQAL